MVHHLPAIRAYRRAAHLMVVRHAETPPSRTATKIGGLPCLLEGERWPICTECHHPMTFMFQLNFRDIPPGNFRIGRYDMLTFYYCLDCAPRSSHEPKGHHLLLRQATSAKALQPAPFAVHDPDSSEPQECAVIFRAIEDLPPPENVISILGTDPAVLRDYEDFVANVRGGNLGASKIAGYPHWLQAEPTLHCQCATVMRFLGQIDSDPRANLLWGDNGMLYLFYCPKVCRPQSVAFVIQSE